MTSTPDTKKSKPNSMLGLVGGIGGFAIGALAMNFLMNGGKSEIEQIEQQLSGSRVGAIVKVEFPDDYAEALKKFSGLINDKSLSVVERGQKAASIIAAIRVKYSEFAGRASDTSLRKVVGGHAALLRAIEEKLGATQCAEAANKGPAVLAGTPESRQIFDAMDIGGAAMMTAMAEGRHNPVSRSAAGVADFDALLAAMRASGANEKEIAMMEDGAVSDQDCRTAIAMYEAALVLQGETGERIRSYIVDTSAATP